MTERTIDECLDRDAPRVLPTTPMREALTMLLDTGAPLACVVDEDGALIGVLTPKDCFRPALNASYYQQWRGAAQDYMSTEATCLDVDTDIIAAAEMFITSPYHAFPVTSDGALVGVLTRRGLLQTFLTLG